MAVWHPLHYILAGARRHYHSTHSTHWPHLQVALPAKPAYHNLSGNPRPRSASTAIRPARKHCRRCNMPWAATGLHHSACGYWQMYFQLFHLLSLSHSFYISRSLGISWLATTWRLLQFYSPACLPTCFIELQ